MGEGILKWDDSAAAFNQPASEVNTCNVAELINLFFAEKRVKWQNLDVSHEIPDNGQTTVRDCLFVVHVSTCYARYIES